MKKINLLLATLFAGVIALMTSCEPSEDAVGPTLEFNASGISSDVTIEVAGADTTITFSWTAKQGDAKLESFTIKNATNNAWTDLTNYTWDGTEDPASFSKDTYAGTATFSVIKQSSDENYKFSFTVTDKDGLTDSKDIIVTISPKTAGSAGEPINRYTGVVAYGQSATGADEGSYIKSDGTVVTSSGALNDQAGIDFVYFYGATNLASIGAPDDNDIAVILGMTSGMTTKNATRFSTTTISATDFDAMSDDSSISDLTGFSNTKMNQLSTNDVIAFKTTDGEIGLIKVNSVVTGADGSINFDMVIQQ